MKSILILTSIIILFFSGTGEKCPIKGDSKDAKHQVSDSLKNRTSGSKKIVKLFLDDVLNPGDDAHRFNEKTFVSISGYVLLVKRGGPETCNCHSTDKTQLDIHIELVKDISYTEGTDAMIVEINRFTIAKHPEMSYDSIRLLKGKRVQIKGWLFFDDEHKQNAVNTRPNGTNLWRATCWEVHPCTYIKEVK